MPQRRATRARRKWTWRAISACLILAHPLGVHASAAPSKPPPTLHLSTAQGSLAYDDTGGSGPLVIATPGLGDVRQEYRRLTPFLTKAGFRVATLDLRGFGGSSARWKDYSPQAIGSDILRLETVLGRPRAILIGNSYSGAADEWAAHDAPERVIALVLIDPFLRDPPGTVPWVQRAAMALAFACPCRVSLWMRYWDSLFPTRTPPDQAAYRAALARNLRQPGRMAALDAMLHASRAPTAAILGQVRVPTLVVMGSRDPDFNDPAAEAAWIAGRTGARTRMIEGAGHYPHVEMPAQVGPDVVRFLDAPLEASRGAR